MVLWSSGKTLDVIRRADFTFVATCWNCKTDFTTNSKLHAHFEDCKPLGAAELPTEANANFANTDLPTFTSDRKSYQEPGYVFRAWRYATAAVGLLTRENVIMCTFW